MSSYFWTVIHDQKLKARWAQVVGLLSDKFSDGEPMDLDGIIFLVGLQELGRWDKSFKKDEKVQLMHIAICRLLEPYGYYRFDYVDDDGWPHYELIKSLPVLKAGEQSLLMKEAIVGYFLDKKLID
ncbi:MAG: hypothetical protein ACPF99_00505 [Flavobacteriaceae bacterium]